MDPKTSRCVWTGERVQSPRPRFSIHTDPEVAISAQHHLPPRGTLPTPPYMSCRLFCRISRRATLAGSRNIARLGLGTFPDKSLGFVKPNALNSAIEAGWRIAIYVADCQCVDQLLQKSSHTVIVTL